MINFIPKKSEIANHTLNIASAVKLNKEITPHLFCVIRLGLVALNSCLWFGCESLKQLNYRRYKNEIKTICYAFNTGFRKL